MDIFDKYFQPECAGICMIYMPHLDSSAFDSAEFIAVNRQF
jgi:hypothetical protein